MNVGTVLGADLVRNPMGLGEQQGAGDAPIRLSRRAPIVRVGFEEQGLVVLHVIGGQDVRAETDDPLEKTDGVERRSHGNVARVRQTQQIVVDVTDKQLFSLGDIPVQTEKTLGIDFLDRDARIDSEATHLRGFLDNGMDPAPASPHRQKEQNAHRHEIRGTRRRPVPRRRVPLSQPTRDRGAHVVEPRGVLDLLHQLGIARSVLPLQGGRALLGEGFALVVPEAFRFGMEDIGVVGNRKLEPGVLGADAVVVLLAVALGEGGLVHFADGVDDLAPDHEAESIHERRRRVAPLRDLGDHPCHVVRRHLGRQRVDREVAVGAEEVRHVLPAGGVGERPDDADPRARGHATHQPPEPAGRGDRVAVQRDHIRGRGGAQPGVHRPGVAAVGRVLDQLEPLPPGAELPEPGRRLGLRAVVDDEDAKPEAVMVALHGLEAEPDVLEGVVHGDDDVDARRHVGRGDDRRLGRATFGLPVRDVVQQRVDPGIGDIRIGAEIVPGVEAGTRVASQMRADPEIVLDRVHAERGDVRVLGQIPFPVEQARRLDRRDLVLEPAHRAASAVGSSTETRPGSQGARPSVMPWSR